MNAKSMLAVAAVFVAQFTVAHAAPLLATTNAYNVVTGQTSAGTDASNGPAASSNSGLSSPGASASSFASGDLTTGKLRATATSGITFDVIPLTGTVITNHATAYASIALTDSFSIISSFSGVQTATLVIAVDGTLVSGPAALDFNGASAFASFQFTVEGGLTGRVDGIAQFQDRCSGPVCNSLPYLQVGEGFKTASFSIPLLFSQGANSFTLSSTLLAEAMLGGQALFGNTADISLILPTGTTVTSASGFLFSADAVPVTSVPEPGTAGILALGLLGLAGAQRRGRKAAARAA